MSAMPLNFDSSTRPLGALAVSSATRSREYSAETAAVAPMPLMNSRREVVMSMPGSNRWGDRRHIKLFDANRRNQRRVRCTKRLARLHRYWLADKRQVRVA